MNIYRVNWNIKKSITLSATSNESLKSSKNHIFLIKLSFFVLFEISVAVMMKKYLKIIYIFTEAIEILKILGLNNKMN